MLETSFALVSLILFILITVKFPKLKTSHGSIQNLRVSVVIPARNEEENLKLLLDDLSNQSLPAFETIVVNDGSTDNTSEVASSLGARVLNVDQSKRGDVLGKPFACHSGYLVSSGDIILFLDADTRPKETLIQSIVHEMESTDVECVSLQPYHRTKKIFEQFSFFFHLVSIAGSGLMSLIKYEVGLFGPCIAISKTAYEETGGFSNSLVNKSIIEDLQLGRLLKSKSIRTKRFFGKNLIEYRMYQSLNELIDGWKKNISTGSKFVPLFVMLILVAFIGSLISLPFNIVKGAEPTYVAVSIVGLIYVYLVSRKLGNYALATIFYPFTLGFFVYIYLSSIVNKVQGKKIVWKGREVQS